MFGSRKNQPQREAAKSVFNNSMYLLANVLAVAAAFIGTGPAYDASIDWVQDFTARQYGRGFDDIVSIFWFAIVGLTTFALARATITTAIIFGSTAVAARFL